MSLNKKQRNKGFTIVEALVAILILTVSVSSMLGVTASTTISARYARNEITANYLLQEAVDSIRNSRDSLAFQQKPDNDIAGVAWGNFISRYGSPSSKCFSANGCDLKIEDYDAQGSGVTDIVDCNASGCPVLNYDPSGATLFYNHTSGDASIFTRKINITKITDDELKVKATVSWKNESSTITKSQSLEISLLNWQKDI